MTDQGIPFVTCVCARDVHYGKALLGSISYFYPDNPIIVVADTDVWSRDLRQISHYPNTRVYRVMDLVQQHKLHLTGLLAKFNVLFLPGLKSALVADADSVLVSPVLEMIDPATTFTSLHGRRINFDDASEREAFDRWAVDLKTIVSFDTSFMPRPRYFLQGSHFYVNTARFPFDIFYKTLKWMSYDHGTLAPLRAGDQGFWNYLVNSGGVPEAEFELRPVTISSGQTPKVASCDDMEWLLRRVRKEWSFIHYVGFSRKYRRRDHDYGRALRWATDRYYDKIGRFLFWNDECLRFARTVVRMGSRYICR